MSVLERLNEAKNTYAARTHQCKLFKVFNQAVEEKRLTAEEFSAIVEVLNIHDKLHPEHIPNIQLSHVLRSEGLDVSTSAVDRHRNKQCSCFRRAN